MTRVLLVIPSKVKHGVEPLVAADRHPMMDYWALYEKLKAHACDVDLIDYSSVGCAGARGDLALAFKAAGKASSYDSVFTNGENLAIPLALFLSLRRNRPRHVTIGHRLSTGKKRMFFRRLPVCSAIDRIMVYSSVQLQYALDRLRISPELLRRINFHADERFFHPMPLQSACPRQICSAGLEWRDYPTLIDASRSVAGIEIKLAAASPWSKHRNETEGRTLPENVSAKRYEYAQLRELYAQSAAVAVPLYENDFQAGVTTILEAMAMGRPVIVTRTTGQVDVVRDNETGITVAPGDTDGWADAINTVFDNPVEMAQMGNRGREWLLANATLTKWCDVIADEILGGTAVRTNATDRHHAPGKFNLARARADSMRSDK